MDLKSDVTIICNACGYRKEYGTGEKFMVVVCNVCAEAGRYSRQVIV